MIIFLNGTSSSGKSTIIEALNIISPKPFLHLGIDVIYHLLPPSYINSGENSSQGFKTYKNGANKIEVNFGPYGSRVRHCSAQLVNIFAQQGIDVIVDEVLLGDEFLRDYIELLQPFMVYFVGIFCDVKILRERELLRGNRMVGLAENQLEQIHSPDRFYDLMLDSGSASPFDNAAKILTFVETNSQPQGFKKCWQRMFGKV